jgi:hypothetical protein
MMPTASYMWNQFFVAALKAGRAASANEELIPDL